jgi:uncharacterized protein
MHVMRGIGFMREGGLPFGILTVVSKELAREPDNLFDFCIKNDLKNIAFTPYTSLNEWLPADDFANFSIRFFDLWYKHGDPDFYVRDFANILSKIFGRKSGLCEYSNCFGGYLCIDTNGDIYICDLLIGNTKMYLGNILNKSLIEILESPTYRELKCLASKNSPSCENCNFFFVCTGGCMYRRYLDHGDFPAKDIYCSARYKIISHIFNRLDESVAYPV